MTTNRLPSPYGRLIQRDKPVHFTFEGKSYTGFEGDTIASALMANGQSVMSRSFKYHRPRSVFSMSGAEANTLMQVDSMPNVVGDVHPISKGLKAEAQNVFGGLNGDKAKWLDKLSRFMPVGFYYHTFFRPKFLWPVWERVIRGLAGLGKVDVSLGHDDSYDKAYTFCDVAVVGAGVSGLSAALEAAQAESDVILIDSGVKLGGSALYKNQDVSDLAKAVENQANIEIYLNATAQGLFADNMLAVIQGKRMYKLRAHKVVVATGVIGQPAVFAGNDLPGVMHASAAQRLMHLYGVCPGHSAAVLTADEDGYACALDLMAAGVTISQVIDLRAGFAATGLMHDAFKAKDIPIRYAAMVSEAQSGADGHLERVIVKDFDGHGRVSGRTEQVSCDVLCISVGVVPNAGLIHHLGTPALYDEEAATFKLPEELPANVFVAGGVNGYRSHVSKAADGKRAAGGAGEVPADPPGYQNHPWPMAAGGAGKAFVDYDEDLQMKDILNAVRSGFSHVQLLKRYSTAGMGPMQGRTGHLAVVRLSAKEAGRPLNKAGMTTLRPPIGGETLGHLAGRQFDPTRYTAVHDRHVELGAEMMVAGSWLRPAYYPQANEHANAAIQREVLAVRNGVGLIDISTLGKLEVRGPDAAEFLNRMHTFAYLKQPVGRLRYALMCGDAGQVIDDGVAARLADDHFYVSATTGGVDGVYRRMLWFNAQWGLKVDIANVTGAYAAFNVAGPDARKVMERLEPSFDVSAEALPYMGAVEGTLNETPVRALRVGFVGELGYELHCPVSQGLSLWDALMDAGKDLNIQPFGVEAQRVLRLEKGHIIVGQDTDGLSTPPEADMAWAIAKKKPFYVGKAAVDSLNTDGPERRLVGFALASGSVLPEESHLVIEGKDIAGRVTSISESPSLGHPLGLAFVRPDLSEVGQSIAIRGDKGQMIPAKVVSLPFYDADGKRQEM
ncbi:2Fe-2S iron-sulfur cluster-binding protein [Magnetovibrio sp. PR-2]|uniref:2Fe-2S iron-sulfur cluster-binding protein n=1 Tax=Magnetovibrio sp. PR-2 TaxID=3120356 RepID=UPI002FCE3E5D